MQILRVLMMVPHVSNMSMFLITTLAIFIISTTMAKPSLSTSKSPSPSPSQDLDSPYTVKSRSLLRELYNDYGFWNPSPVYGGGFPYPGPVPHGLLDPKQRNTKPVEGC
ncbi:hypothetical protein AALP_AA1G292700 [Arabis alpina]|uniref:Uncharacterized protein n=1 Tax=Arabis alpina TaxID=50452 RepID=A0A087HRF6_ARAAL|nr:hypothetical protein AALP_AA1G292700 [Arabis alpina]